MKFQNLPQEYFLIIVRNSSSLLQNPKRELHYIYL